MLMIDKRGQFHHKPGLNRREVLARIHRDAVEIKECRVNSVGGSMQRLDCAPGQGEFRK